MLCALRVLGRFKSTQIHNVGCHLPPCRAAVAGVGAGTYISFIIYFNCRRQLTYKHPIHTPRPLETHASTRHRKTPACTQTTRVSIADRDGHPGGVEGGRGRQHSLDLNSTLGIQAKLCGLEAK